MRTVAATRQTPQADLTSKPRALDWLVYLRDNAGQLKLTKMEWALAAILPTCGQGQNITLSIKGMADILDTDRETAGNALKGLIAKGLAVLVGPGRHNKNVYRLTLPRCRPDRQVGVGETDSEVSVRPTVSDGQTDTTSREDEEADEHVTSTSDDDVPAGTTTPSGEDRAEDDATAKRVTPSIGEYVSDLEGCRDELARRLGFEPGRITVKPLAKKLRSLILKHDDEDAVWSDVLDIFPEDDTVWRMSAGGDNPPGFLLFALEQMLEGNDIRAAYRAPAQVPAVDDDLAARIVDYLAEHGPTQENYFYEPVGSDYDSIQPTLDYLVDIGKILRAENRTGLYYRYKVA